MCSNLPFVVLSWLLCVAGGGGVSDDAAEGGAEGGEFSRSRESGVGTDVAPVSAAAGRGADGGEFLHSG